MSFLRSLGHLLRRIRDQRGAISVFVALGITVFLGMAALAVDLGHLLNVRTESQRVADLSALAGAAALVQNPGPNVQLVARQYAKSFAAQNDVDQGPVLLQDGDIDVDLTNQRVRVTVFHTAGRGNPIPTIFARVLGIADVDIVTTAVAEAAVGVGVNCLLPLTLPDRWQENGGNPNFYDPGIDVYVPWDPDNPTAFHTGWREDDVGTVIVIQPMGGPGWASPDWHYAWRPPGQQGGNDFRNNIRSCVDPTITYFIGQQLEKEPGNMTGPTRQGFRDLIDLDPSAAWNHNLNCVSDQSDVGSANPAVCRSSPRLRPMPMFDPTEQIPNGAHDFTITNFAGVFVQGIQGNNVTAVFAGYTAVAPAGGSATTNTQFKLLRLVE